MMGGNEEETNALLSFLAFTGSKDITQNQPERAAEFLLNPTGHGKILHHL